jgi:hypothetical protein
MSLIMGAIVFVPVALDLLHGGTRAAFRYLAPDSFYYHTVARNIALNGSISYDGQLPTNGFHPLWQATLAVLYFVLHHLGLSESSYLVSSVLLTALLVAGSVTLVGQAVMASGRTLGPTALLAPVGLYAVLSAKGPCINWRSSAALTGSRAWSTSLPMRPGNGCRLARCPRWLSSPFGDSWQGFTLVSNSWLPRAVSVLFE